DIAAAKVWAARRPEHAPAPTVLHLDFIKASEHEETSRASVERKRLDDMAAAQAERATALKAAEEALQREAQAERQRAELRKGGFVLLTALVVILCAAVAVAEIQRRHAVANLRAGQVTESHFRAEQAARALVGGDAATAALLALDGLPDTTSDDSLRRDRPY